MIQRNNCINENTLKKIANERFADLQKNIIKKVTEEDILDQLKLK